MALTPLTYDGLRTMTQIIPKSATVLGDGSLSITTLASLGELFTSLALQASAERRELISTHEQRDAVVNQRFSQLSDRLDSTVRANSEMKAQLDAAKAQLDAAKADNFMLTTTNDTLRSRVAALEPEAPAKKSGSKPVALSTMPGAKGSADVVDLEVTPLAEDSGK